jgi:hypothetical protein
MLQLERECFRTLETGPDDLPAVFLGAADPQVHAEYVAAPEEFPPTEANPRVEVVAVSRWRSCSRCPRCPDRRSGRSLATGCPRFRRCSSPKLLARRSYALPGASTELGDLQK